MSHPFFSPWTCNQQSDDNTPRRGPQSTFRWDGIEHNEELPKYDDMGNYSHRTQRYPKLLQALFYYIIKTMTTLFQETRLFDTILHANSSHFRCISRTSKLAFEDYFSPWPFQLTCLPLAIDHWSVDLSELNGFNCSTKLSKSLGNSSHQWLENDRTSCAHLSCHAMFVADEDRAAMAPCGAGNWRFGGGAL